MFTCEIVDERNFLLNWICHWKHLAMCWEGGIWCQRS
jgi:hypothetical protein